ncbi:hypothetical protein [Senegalimassilia anaerobia]
MAISDTERRVVAARLRGLDEHIDGVPPMCSPQVHNAMELSAIRAVVGKGDVFHLLADLIDRPTAKQEHNGAYWRCAHCGAFTRKDAVVMDGLDVVPLRCCGNCGREWE